MPGIGRKRCQIRDGKIRPIALNPRGPVPVERLAGLFNLGVWDGLAA